MTSTSELKAKIVALLTQNGYVRLSSPISIGDIPVDLDCLLQGPANTLTLAVVLERPTDREEDLRAYWQVQRLARALDAFGSRRTITVILAGEAQESRLVGELQPVARVLTVDETLPLRRLLSPLLPLEVTSTAERSRLDGATMLRTVVTGQYSVGLLRLIDACADGAETVGALFGSWIDEAFVGSMKRSLDRIDRPRAND